MRNAILLPCDGCGQLAGPEHITRRLQRLQWATRFRPIHLQTLLLGGISPQTDAEYLYTPEGPVLGEAKTILAALSITAERTREAVLGQLQKSGVVLTHILECPLDPGVPQSEAVALLRKQLLAAISRIRRSLKPRRVLLLSADLEPVAEQLRRTDLGCPILPAQAGAFLASLAPKDKEIEELRVALDRTDG